MLLNAADGRLFAFADANGDGLYQAGSDYVFEFFGTIGPLNSLNIFVTPEI